MLDTPIYTSVYLMKSENRMVDCKIESAYWLNKTLDKVGSDRTCTILTKLSQAQCIQL